MFYRYVIPNQYVAKLIYIYFRVKKKEVDLLNSMDRSNALEEELRNLGNRLSKTEDEHRRTQDQLRVSNLK